MSFEENFYILNCHSYIKTVPNYFCMDFIKDLKNEDGTFKPHVTELNTNYVQYGVLKCHQDFLNLLKIPHINMYLEFF